MHLFPIFRCLRKTLRTTCLRLLHFIVSIVSISGAVFQRPRVLGVCMRLRIALLTALLTLVLCAGVAFISVAPIQAQQTTQTCSNPSCNPWGFNFHQSSLISHPPARFCSVFPCIANFWNGKGYVVECHDAKYSLSGGRRGVCSHHHGAWRPLYSH